MTAGTGRITCKNLWKVFGPDPSGALERLAEHSEATLDGHVAAVRDVSFSVEPGQTCVVMGLSGSGKSTLVRCLTRLIEPTAGTIAIDGEELTRLSPRALRALRQAKLAMVFQHFGLFPHMTVVENVAYGLEVRGADRKTRRTRAEEMIALVGLEGWEQAYPSALSGGMQQRVGIARALAVEPEVLFFDEPFSALDPLIRNEMQAELVRLQARMRATPPAMVEVAQGYGASPVQILIRIRLPVAMASVFVGMNQTIMMALGLVVLAALIGAPGLGSEIWLALQKLDVGKALEGGICIVTMAIAFDRILAAATRVNNARADRDSARPARGWRAGIAKNRFAVLSGLTIALVLLDATLRGAGLGAEFPGNLEFDMRGPVNGFVQSVITVPALFKATEAATWAAYTFLLNPIQSALTALPFWAFGAAAALLAGRIGGWHLAALTMMALGILGFSGLWFASMQTLAAVVVAVAICVLLGCPLAIWAGRNPRVDRVLKPVLDTMQTLPAFVYLVPVIMLFGGNIVSALIATVIYALPPVVRIGAMGFRDIPKEVDEALASFGTHPLHGFWRVRLPLAMPALVAGMNQAIMMALAMQVITPLIGGGGLGREVYHALGLSDSGRGLVAGVCVVMIAIVLDRVLSAWAERRQRALSGASN